MAGFCWRYLAGVVPKIGEIGANSRPAQRAAVGTFAIPRLELAMGGL
jgi:hypothetical protein